MSLRGARAGASHSDPPPTGPLPRMAMPGWILETLQTSGEPGRRPHTSLGPGGEPTEAGRLSLGPGRGGGGVGDGPGELGTGASTVAVFHPVFFFFFSFFF